MTTSLRTDHITDDYMHNRISQAKTYTLMVLRPTPEYFAPTPEYFAEGSRPIVWEHGRRNMALQAAGIMPIVCPVGDDEISGIGIFNTGPDEARSLMADDPGVRAGIFTFEVHTCRGSPVMPCPPDTGSGASETASHRVRSPLLPCGE